MQIKAYQRFIRTSPRKLRLVAAAVRGLTLVQARGILDTVDKRAGLEIRKVLRQAEANATGRGLAAENLRLAEIQINAGPTYKRFQPVSRGRAHSIKKRTSHIRVILEASDTHPIHTQSPIAKQPIIKKIQKPNTKSQTNSKSKLPKSPKPKSK